MTKKVYKQKMFFSILIKNLNGELSFGVGGWNKNLVGGSLLGNEFFIPRLIT